MVNVDRREIAAGFKRVKLEAGDVVLVHASLRSFGRVEGGAGTVAKALVGAVGPMGTVVVPTFTFKHEAAQDPIIDPEADKSEMGAITEAVRTMPGARRSITYRHSVAAIGKNAELIAGTDPEVSPFDMRGSFGKMLDLNAKVLFLGTTYYTSTSHHFAEYLLQVSYRHTIPMEVKVRMPDGTVKKQKVTDYQPKPTADGRYYHKQPDFNKLGRMLEQKGLVNVTSTGNAIIRLFRMRDLIELARKKYSADPDIFLMVNGQTDLTPLPDGVSVWSEEILDGAGRPSRALRSVVDPDGMYG